MEKRIGVIGGDRRQIFLAGLLEENGWQVHTWGLEQGDPPHPATLDKVLTADILLLPLPILRSGSFPLPLTEEALSPDQLWSKIRPHQLVLGGMVGNLPEILQEKYGITLLDYFAPEIVQILNAVPTAEGAIQYAMEASDGILQGSRCLITGYGRIGKVLCHRLLSLGAEVSVTARSREALTWAKVLGAKPVPLSMLADAMPRFDFVFNTVPARLLDAALLERTSPRCILMELASGGFDPKDAADRIVISAGGLPGKVAPKEAAAALLEGITICLEESFG